MVELARPSPSSTPSQLATLAKQHVACGADALCVRIDAEDTPEGSKDLFSVVQAVKVPVLARDWYIHPIQVGAKHRAPSHTPCGALCVCQEQFASMLGWAVHVGHAVTAQHEFVPCRSRDLGLCLA